MSFVYKPYRRDSSLDSKPFVRIELLVDVVEFEGLVNWLHQRNSRAFLNGWTTDQWLRSFNLYIPDSGVIISLEREFAKTLVLRFPSVVLTN
jgi:hypothetical protein